MKSGLLLILSVVALSACSTTARLNAVNPGMTKTEVLRAVGAPETTSSPGNDIELLHYKLMRSRSGLRFPTGEDYQVRLVHGQVQAYGLARDIPPLTAPAPRVIYVPEKNEKTVNVNIRSDATSATNAPTITPRVNIETN